MFTQVISTPVSPYYLVAIPYGPQICFEVCAVAYEVKEAKVLIYGSLTQSRDHVGGMLVVKEAYHRHLLERHQTYQSARHSFKFWVSHFNDPRATQFSPDPLKTPEVAAPTQFGSNICSSDFSNLAARSKFQTQTAISWFAVNRDLWITLEMSLILYVVIVFSH